MALPIQECADCEASVFLHLFDTFDDHKSCWEHTEIPFIAKLQMVALEEMITNFGVLNESINELVPAECRTEVQLKECDETAEQEEQEECLMENLKTLIYNYRDQELCYGEPFDFEMKELLRRQMMGFSSSLSEILPECI